MGEPVAGKFLLEILTKGMYSNPMHVYREYIQNSTDSIDKAISESVLTASEAAIHIQIDSTKRNITIHDNGCGITVEKAREIYKELGQQKEVNFLTIKMQIIERNMKKRQYTKP